MSVLAGMYERFNFELPASLEAAEPPEARGLARDGVRMLVTHKSSRTLVSTTFRELPDHLEPGDLVVINTSGTIPAAVEATAGDGTTLMVHLSSELDAARWIVELRRNAGGSTQRWSGPIPSLRLWLRGGASLELEEPYGTSDRLWVATLRLGEPVLRWLETHGRPIRYGYVHRTWPIEMYQNVYATEYGSAEMPRCRVPVGPLRPTSSPGLSRREWVLRRFCCTPVSPLSKRTRCRTQSVYESRWRPPNE